MLDRIAGNGIRTILVESPDRFARDLAVQLAGHDHLRSLGVTLIPASSPDFLIEDTPTAVLVRQVLGAIAQFEKATTVAKLRRASAQARCRRKSRGSEELGGAQSSELVATAKRLRRRSPKGHQRSLRDIADELAKLGFTNERRVRFSASSIASMVSG
ncbi:recombinase family protein [Bradyrhizobium diazoefficiens]|nr:recombinase family protein [Bradyrhizobium diazoefficiens]